MSMSRHVEGFRSPDEKWKKMKAIFDSCTEANVTIPNEVDEFFDGEEPDESGVRVELDNHPCCSEYTDDMVDGFEIDLSKLPKNVTKIRFYNLY